MIFNFQCKLLLLFTLITTSDPFFAATTHTCICMSYATWLCAKFVACSSSHFVCYCFCFVCKLAAALAQTRVLKHSLAMCVCVYYVLATITKDSIMVAGVNKILIEFSCEILFEFSSVSLLLLLFGA